MAINTRISKSAILANTLALIAAVTLLTPAAQASDPTSERLQRKVKVMQRVIDEVLVQSEHVRVSPGGVTRGLVLDEYGVLFTFDATVGESLMFGGWFVPEAGAVFGESLDLRDNERAPEPEKRPDIGEWKAKNKEAKEKQQQDRKAFKSELIDALLDFGVTLTELDDDRWVVIAAFLGSSGPFGSGDDDDRLVIRVKMRDLRAFMTGSLSREEARAAVVVEG